VVGDALTEIDAEAERLRARELIRRRRRTIAHLPAQTQVRRLVGLLARKGYPAALAYQVVRDELASDPELSAMLDPTPGE
jgi:regulatory protein